MAIKRLILFIIGIVICHLIYSQVKIEKFECWVDQNFGDRSSIAISPSADVDFTATVGLNTLSNGIHTIFYRFMDDKKNWSSPAAHIIYAGPVSYNESVADSKIVGIEYWIDNKFASRTRQAISPEASVSYLNGLHFSNLQQGVHTISCRFFDSRGRFSAVSTFLFVGTSLFADVVPQQKAIYQYEFWFNNNFAERKTVQINPGASFVELSDIKNPGGLKPGVHSVSIRLKDSGGWSSMVKSLFQNLNSYTNEIPKESEIVQFRVCFQDNSLGNFVFKPLEIPQKVVAIDTAYYFFPYFTEGDHNVIVQAKDKHNRWSSPVISVFNATKEAMSNPVVPTKPEGTTTTCKLKDTYFTKGGARSQHYSWKLDPASAGDISDSAGFACKISWKPQFDGVAKLYTRSVNPMGVSNYSNPLEITRIANTVTSVSQKICDGDSVLLGGKYRKVMGVYNDTTVNNGCDLLKIVTLTVQKATINLGKDTSIFDNQSLTLAGGSFKSYLWNSGSTANQISIDKTLGLGSHKIWLNVTDDMGCKASDTILVTIDKYNSIIKLQDIQISIYPNPASDNLIICLNNSEIKESVNIEIVDILGRVYDKMTVNADKSIDVRNYPNGVYLVKLNYKNQKGFYKILISR